MTDQDGPSRLAQGDVAPTFTLVDQSGGDVSLAELKGQRVLVYFYPKADTPGCTTQACGLRDAMGQLGATAVIGISPDPPKRQAAFDHKYGLGFPLLADVDHKVAEAYGVWVQRSMYGRSYMGIERSAFLVGPDGLLQEVWYKVSPAGTVQNLLAALKE
jgi:thioredoxin-dependent peroxiredoxin